MAIIDPEGMYSGDRLAACSDRARLFWPWLFLGSNSYGRIELSYSAIVSRIFRSFAQAPSSQELWAIFREYERCFLAVIYSDHGRWWCQFVTSEKFLPKYKSKRDDTSPAPPAELVEKQKSGYLSWKSFKSNDSNDFGKSSDFSKPFQGQGEERRGVGVVEEFGGTRTREASAVASPETPSLVKQIVCAHPKSVLRQLRPNETSYADETAVIEAMASEIEASGSNSAEVLAMILERTQLLADKVPRDRWKYFKDVPEFYRKREYRREPESFMDQGNGKTGKSRSGNVERVASGQAAWDGAFEDDRSAEPAEDAAQADDRGVPAPGDRGGDGPGVDPGIRGANPAPRNGGTRDGPAIVLDAAEILSPSQRSK